MGLILKSLVYGCGGLIVGALASLFVMRIKRRLSDNQAIQAFWKDYNAR